MTEVVDVVRRAKGQTRMLQGRAVYAVKIRAAELNAVLHAVLPITEVNWPKSITLEIPADIVERACPAVVAHYFAAHAGIRKRVDAEHLVSAGVSSDFAHS